MKALNENLFGNVAPVAIDVDMHSNVANMPRFLMPTVSFCDIGVEVSVSADAEDYEGNLVAGVSILEKDQFDVYQYQYMTRNRSGNPHYGRVFPNYERGAALVFKSGWSGRASVMASKFGVPLVECYGSGFVGLALEFTKYLELVAQNYEGLVYLGVEIADDGELGIDIAPYDVDNMYKFDDDRTHAQHSMVLDTRYSEIFLDLAIGFIVTHIDEYISLGSFEVQPLTGYNYTAHDSGSEASILEGEDTVDDGLPF